MKNRWVAAILNFITIGLGTVYVGKRPLVGLLMTLGAGVFLRYEELRIAPLQTGTLTIRWIFAITGLTLLGIGTAIDGYREAQSK